jgi:hypothetical protein
VRIVFETIVGIAILGAAAVGVGYIVERSHQAQAVARR